MADIVVVEEWGNGYRWAAPCGEKGKVVWPDEYMATLKFSQHSRDCGKCKKILEYK